MKSKTSSFAILTCFVCLCIIGASMIPLLSVQLNPSNSLPSLNVSFGWNDVSAKVIEQEVTSKLEGVFNTVKGIKEISSTTDKESGSITIPIIGDFITRYSNLCFMIFRTTAPSAKTLMKYWINKKSSGVFKN
jgi:Cu/Ag efflux pump CusA